jgi:hypothetical protein
MVIIECLVCKYFKKYLRKRIISIYRCIAIVRRTFFKIKEYANNCKLNKK